MDDEVEVEVEDVAGDEEVVVIVGGGSGARVVVVVDVDVDDDVDDVVVVGLTDTSVPVTTMLKNFAAHRPLDSDDQLEPPSEEMRAA